MSSDTPQIAPVRLAVTTALIEGDTAAAFRHIRGLLDDGVPLDVILFDVIAGAHADFGRRWQYGDYRIADEHAASGSVESLLAMLAGSLEIPAGGMFVVTAAAEGDQHSLPVRLVSVYLSSLGYRVRYLGANMESNDLGAYLEGDRPQALVLSCAMPMLLHGARRSIEAAHRAGVPVLAGGPGFGPDGIWAYGVGADAFAASPREIDETLSSWEPDIEVAEQLVPPRPPDLDVIARQRHQILAAAEVALTTPSGRLSDEISLTLMATESALLVEDASLLDGFFSWQSALLSSHDFGGDASRDLRRALAGALQNPAPAAADLLGR